MNDDVESFNYVCNLLEIHLHEPSRRMLRAFRDEVKEARRNAVQYPNVAIKGEDLINLWLNTVFAHSGLKGKKPTRQDFDQQISIFGQGAMEYAFRHLVLMIGLSYRNVANGTIRFGVRDRWRNARPTRHIEGNEGVYQSVSSRHASKIFSHVHGSRNDYRQHRDLDHEPVADGLSTGID